MLVLLLQAGKVEAQNNLTMKSYGLIGGGGITIDGAVLDGVFGTVTIDGTTVSTSYSAPSDITNIPTTVAGFGGVQVVYVNALNQSGYGTSITQAQADA